MKESNTQTHTHTHTHKLTSFILVTAEWANLEYWEVGEQDPSQVISIQKEMEDMEEWRNVCVRVCREREREREGDGLHIQHYPKTTHSLNYTRLVLFWYNLLLVSKWDIFHYSAARGFCSWLPVIALLRHKAHGQPLSYTLSCIPASGSPNTVIRHL